MPQPQFGYDHRAENAYVRQVADGHNLPALCVLPNDLGYTLTELRSKKYRAVKSYPHYTEPPFRYIVDFFPHEILETCAEQRTPIILHVPRPLPECVHEVTEIARRYPQLPIILAHAGRSQHSDRAYVSALRRCAPHMNVHADSSMVTDTRVLGSVVRELGPSRMLYGSDEPFSLLRYRTVHTKRHGSLAVPAHPYHWEKPDAKRRYGHMATHAPMIHFQSLAALINAIDWNSARTGADPDETIGLVFHDTAARLFKTGEHHE
jgi:hypothetical protein